MKRIPLTLFLAIQVLGGGAVTLAHARDVVAAPPAVEASHDARCAILHDELRCALCHYASTRVLVQQTIDVPVAPARAIRIAAPVTAGWTAPTFTITISPRAPPLVLS